MELTFLGGAREVGASCTLFQVIGHHILIDGGMRPAAREGQPKLPNLALLEAHPPEALLITHAHIDHTGALPLIASLYPHIPIYATESTRVLTEILLRDSVRIMEQEGLGPDGEIPLYSADQVDALLRRITSIGFHQPFNPLASVPSLSVRYLPAGHILGAAMLYIETPEGTVLHTGDISVTDQRTIKGLDVQGLPQVDVMICEGTYGGRSHTNRKEEERKLAETVQATLKQGGRILCPAFAVGRAQEVILILKSYRSSGQISPVPIYIDGMVRSVCNAYQMQAHDLHLTLQRYLTNARRPLFADPGLHIFAVRSQERAALVSQRTPKIVISSSGMLSGGASPVYATDITQHEEDCILFTGYQDEESPGAALLKAKQGDTLRIGGQSFALNCQIARYNLSGHADGEQIAHVITKVAPKRLILVHGAPESLEELARRITKIEVDIPAVGSTITIRTKTGSPQALTAPGTTKPILQNGREISLADKKTAAREERAAATSEMLWQVAVQQGPTRPWTAVELGQHYYGSAYHPGLRSQIEAALKEAAPYFKQGRVGAQPTYLPRKLNETEQLRPILQLTPGEIVIVQGQKGAPQLGLLLSTPQEGMISLVSDQWKVGNRPMNVIQLITGIQRPDLLTIPTGEARQQLIEWRKRLDEEWVDLLAYWEQCQEKQFTYVSLCARLPSDDLRLAWSLELLSHGLELFQRDGSTWTPVEAQRVLANAGFFHHLELVRAGAGASVYVHEQQGTLTGRSNWRLFEVKWNEGEEIARVRGSNIALSIMNHPGDE